MSIMESLPPAQRPIAEDGAIMALWRLKLDTLEIARSLGVPECAVANRLAVVRDHEAARG